MILALFLVGCLMAGDLCMFLLQWLAWFFMGACGVLRSAPDDSLEIFAVPLDLVAMPWSFQRGGCGKFTHFPP